MSSSRKPARYVSDAGTCPTCGKFRYMSRSDARHVAKLRSMRGVNAYQCGDYWHLGHAPAVVRKGLATRDDIRPPRGPRP